MKTVFQSPIYLFCHLMWLSISKLCSKERCENSKNDVSLLRMHSISLFSCTQIQPLSLNYPFFTPPDTCSPSFQTTDYARFNSNLCVICFLLVACPAIHCSNTTYRALFLTNEVSAWTVPLARPCQWIGVDGSFTDCGTCRG